MSDNDILIKRILTITTDYVTKLLELHGTVHIVLNKMVR